MPGNISGMRIGGCYWPGRLLNVLQCKGKPSTMKNYLAPDSSTAEAEKPCSKTWETIKKSSYSQSLWLCSIHSPSSSSSFCWITLLCPLSLRHKRRPPVCATIYLLCLLGPFCFLKMNCINNESLLWRQELVIFQTFSYFLENFALPFLLFCVILKPYNQVLCPTLSVMLVDYSHRKLDHILDWCCPLSSKLQSALLLWKTNVITARVAFIHHFSETLFLQNFLSRW